MAAIGILVPTAVLAQTIGDCRWGTANAVLDVNEISARLHATGSLFHGWGYPGDASGTWMNADLWIGGYVDGELRVNQTVHGGGDAWPGPLDEHGNPPDDCSEYDRVFKVSRFEIDDLDQNGVVADDIADWPWELGAPVEDGDGNPDNYDLAAGDRPQISGDQTLWWVINDRGNENWWTYDSVSSLGLEIQTTAYAVASADTTLNRTIFVRYKLINRQSSSMDSVFFGQYYQGEIGGQNDEYIGSDSTRGLAYFYNSDDFDEDASGRGYGERPPALGITVVDGAEVDGKRLPMTSVIQHSHGGDIYGHPHKPLDIYTYLQAIWPNGRTLKRGGQGIWGEEETKFMFDGRPPEYWSEFTPYPGADSPNGSCCFRWLKWGSGPFTIPAGGSQEITVALIWVQGRDHLDSVYRLIEETLRIKEAERAGLQGDALVRPAVPPDLISPADGVTGQPTNMTLEWTPTSSSDRHQVEVSNADSVVVSEVVRGYSGLIGAFEESPRATFELPPNGFYTWRVRGVNGSGVGPWSETRQFSTNSVELVGPGALTIEGEPGGDPAFVQIQGIGPDDACGPEAVSTFGCREVGGNNVYGSFNGQGDWVMYHQGAGPEAVIGQFAPNDFEIRVTEEGSYAYHPFSDGEGNAHWVPFEVWDIGEVGPFAVNDTLDDVRMVPTIFSDNGGACEFGFGEIEEDPFGLAWGVTDRIYAHYATTTYEDWAREVEPIVAADTESCPTSPETDSASVLIDLGRGRPLQRVTFMMDPTSPNYRPEMIPIGNVIRFYTTKPDPPVQSAPSPDALLTPPFTLHWQVGPGQDSSRVQIIKVSAEVTVAIDSLLGVPRLTVDELDEGLYYWRLSYHGSDWSDGWDFVVLPTTAVEDDGLGLPTTLELKPAYPNPFTTETTLTFGMPEQSRLTVRVFDLLGRQVDELVDSEHPAGWHRLTWQPERLTSAVYFIVAEADGVRQTQPVTVVR